MMIRLLLILSYIFICVGLRVSPRKYFQLNAPFFNEALGMFSKLDMDARIPEQWRLAQCIDGDDVYPDSYPVFVKPEWGQNSHGIERADTISALEAIRARRQPSPMKYLLQSAAPGQREFELFMIPGHTPTGAAVLSITETLNSSGERYPINGIYNQATTYRDLTCTLSSDDKQRVVSQLRAMGNYRIARYGVRADSLSALVEGRFHVIEINLFLPMPLVLLAENIRVSRKIGFALQCMWQLAKITKTIPADQPHKAVFFRKLKIARSLKSDTKTRKYNDHIQKVDLSMDQ